LVCKFKINSPLGICLVITNALKPRECGNRVAIIDGFLFFSKNCFIWLFSFQKDPLPGHVFDDVYTQ
jgi:hypothetical protein